MRTYDESAAHLRSLAASARASEVAEKPMFYGWVCEGGRWTIRCSGRTRDECAGRLKRFGGRETRITERR
jgi:hypothetical protein